jgi:hypothetical protein
MVISTMTVMIVVVVTMRVGRPGGRRHARGEQVSMWAGMRMGMHASPVTMLDRAHAEAS